MAFFGHVWTALDGLGQEAGKHVGGAAVNTWKALDGFGQEAGKHVGGTAAVTWQALDGFGQEAGKNVHNAAVNTKDWVVKHPGETAAIAGCVVAPIVAVAAVPAVLGAIGFGSGGVIAGKHEQSIDLTVGLANQISRLCCCSYSSIHWKCRRRKCVCLFPERRGWGGCIGHPQRGSGDERCCCIRRCHDSSSAQSC
jgi:hypothetical protein